MDDDLNSQSVTIPHATRTSYPVRSGNNLRPLIDGEPAFRRVCEAIETMFASSSGVPSSIRNP